MSLLNSILLLDVHMGPSVGDMSQLLLYLLVFSIPVLLVVLLVLKSRVNNKKKNNKEK